MKKLHLLLAIVAMLFSTTAFAQEQWYGEQLHNGGLYPGEIVTATGETLKGFIEYNSRTEMQTKCVFYSDQNDKKSKVVYKPEQLKSYSVADKTYRAIHYSGGLMAGPVRFVWLIKDGRIAQYKWFDVAEGASTMRKTDTESQADFEARQYTNKIVYQKLEEKPMDSQGMALQYNKRMTELTADYPELSQKVANKEKGYGLGSIDSVIEQYNAHFAK